MTLTPKNWKEFQHYKDRAPAWIKLHRGLLNDFKFHRLPVASKALAPMLWLLASEYEDGAIPLSLEEIGFRLHQSEDDLREALSPLLNAGFFSEASGSLAGCKRDASLEKEKEKEKEKEGEEKTEEEEKDAAADAARPFEPSLSPSPEVDLYRRGKEILGAKGGGVIKKLVDAKGGNVALARSVVETASTKQDPREYIGAIIRNRDSPEDLRARGEAW